MKTETKRDLAVNVKNEAQDDLIDAMMVAFYKVYDGHKKLPEGWTEDEYLAVLKKQADRARKMFGYSKPLFERETQ